MKRLLVIGNSHVGAVRAAHGRIAQTYPEAELAFFALPGAQFAYGRTAYDGVFRIDRSNAKAVRQAKVINNRTDVDLKAFDHIFLVGPRFRLQAALRFFTSFDVAEWPGRTDSRLASEHFIEAAANAYAQAGVKEIRNQFPASLPLITAAAAYPDEEVSKAGPHRDRVFERINLHPDRSRYFALFNKAVDQALASAGIVRIYQPEETLAAPFLTRSEFARDALDIRDETKRLPDRRHMNADYGFALFGALAKKLSAGTFEQIRNAGNEH